jgi:hypothetical protein
MQCSEIRAKKKPKARKRAYEKAALPSADSAAG